MDNAGAIDSVGDFTTADARWQHIFKESMYAGRMDLKDLPSPTPTCAKLYVSAPYSDFTEELYVLEADVVAKLKEYCRVAHGIEFDAVHLYSGYNTVNSTVRMAAKKLSLFEIEDSQDTSVGPNYLSLIGQRYGLSLGPPSVMKAHTFQAAYQTLLADGHDVDLLEKHYKLDKNAAETCVYHLIPNKTSTYRWLEVEKKLTNLLCSYGAKSAGGTSWLRPTSDIQDEVEAGMLSIVREKGRNDNCICFKRVIDDVQQHLSSRLSSVFVDVVPGKHFVDEQQANMLQDLQAAIDDKLSPNCILTEHVTWVEPNGIDRKSHKAYLQKFGRGIFEQVRRHIDVCMMEWSCYPREELFSEVLQHWHVARELASHFWDQEETLVVLRNYISAMSNHVLVCHGPIGCGKTATMAKIACELATTADVPSRGDGAQPQLPTMLVIRFIGLTPDSTSLLCLMQSLINQLQMVLHLPASATDKMSLSEAKQTLMQLLRDGEFNSRVVLILDGVDYIHCSTASATDFDWLPVHLPANVKIILSATEGHKSRMLHQLRSREGSSIKYVQMQNMLPETCLHITGQRLHAAGRQLTEQQWRCVSTAFNACSTPLFAEIVFNEVSQWSSEAAPRLSSSVDDMLHDFMQRLEKKHGVTLVANTLCYITCAHHGLSEAELLDVLSLDDQVLAAVFTDWEPPVRRIPRISWVMLKYDLVPFLRRIKSHGLTLLKWRHSSFPDVVRSRYVQSKSELLRHVHGCLADFFLGLWHGPAKKPYDRNSYVAARNAGEVSAAACRHVIGQPTLLSGHGTNVRHNTRKLIELPRHLHAAGRLDELDTLVLFNYDWLHAKLTALGHATTIEDFALVAGDSAEARLVAGALEAAGLCEPAELGIELRGRLLPAAAGKHRLLSDLVRQCDLRAAQHCPVAPNTQLYTSPMAALEHVYTCPPGVAAQDLEMQLIEGAHSQYVCVKSASKELVAFHDVVSHESSTHSFAIGDLYVCPNGVHTLSRQGLIISMWHIGTAQVLAKFDCSDRQPASSSSVASSDCNQPIVCVAIADDYFCFALSRKAGPFLLDLRNLVLHHRFTHHPTALTISEDSHMLACNDGKLIYCYRLPVVDCMYTVCLDDIATTILFCHSTKLYTLTQEGQVRSSSIRSPNGSQDITSLSQDAMIEKMTLSHSKGLLLMRTSKCLSAYDTRKNAVQCKMKRRDITLPRCNAQSGFTDACFSCDDTRIISACYVYVIVFASDNGGVIRVLEAPKPTLVKNICSFKSMNKFSTLLDDGSVHLWNLEHCSSSAKYMCNFFPNAISSLAVSRNGAVIVCCSAKDGNAKAVARDTGVVISELDDPFADGTQPVEVEVSPCGCFAVTRCSNETEGNVNWPVLRNDYVWDIRLNRVTHFFVNSLYVLFSSDSRLLANISCLKFYSHDPSNKLFTTLSYNITNNKIATEENNPIEHRSLLPDGDVIGRPVLSSRDGILVCLLQPCIKTKLTNILVEQRVSDIQLLFLDLFTKAAVDRQLVRCKDLLPTVGDCYFIDMRSTSSDSQLVLFYARGWALPPYRTDGRLNLDVPMSKGMLLFDLHSRQVLKCIDNFPAFDSGINTLLLSRGENIVVDSKLIVQDCSLGCAVSDLSSLATMLGMTNAVAKPCYTLALNGLYIVSAVSAAKPKNGCEVLLLDTRDGTVHARCPIHGKPTVLHVGTDDRTVYIGCDDGRIMVLSLLPHMSDPMKLLISELPSRQPLTVSSAQNGK